MGIRSGLFKGGDEANPAGDGTGPPTEQRPAMALGALYLDGYKLHTNDRKAGAQRVRGDQTLKRGALVAGDGTRAGELFSSALTMPGPVNAADPTTPRLELQNLVLVDGTLVGVGTVFAQDDLPNRYAIIGGSGSYVGLRGTYTFDNNPSVARADGRAMLVFDLDA